jgi:hypothetical protein
MDSAYYETPAGSPEHYAAYEREFNATPGALYAFPDDPQASYEVDNAYELAYEHYASNGDPEADADDLEWDEPKPERAPAAELPEPEISW